MWAFIFLQALFRILSEQGTGKLQGISEAGTEPWLSQRQTAA